MKTGDIVFYRDRYGHHRFWEVLAVCLGGEGQEGLIRLASLTDAVGVDEEGVTHATTVVPETLLRGIPIYTPDWSHSGTR